MKKIHRVFVTGTNTEVGKTVITRAIAGALIAEGLVVKTVKPVESGAQERMGDLVPTDARALARVCNMEDRLDEVCAYKFKEPVSPHLAARLASREIKAEPIFDLLRRAEEDADVVLAEGAGGLLVPLADDLLYGDLIAKSGYRLLIVAPNVLGTINATLLTIEAARRRGIKVAGVILNGNPKDELDNLESIERFGKVKVLGVFPKAKLLDDATLANLAKESLDLSSMMIKP